MYKFKLLGYKFLWLVVITQFVVTLLFMVSVSSSVEDYNKKVDVYNANLSRSLDEYNNRVADYNKQASLGAGSYNDQVDQYNASMNELKDYITNLESKIRTLRDYVCLHELKLNPDKITSCGF